MYFSENFGLFMGAFVVWGFLMAMFFNLMLLGFKAKVDYKLVWTSVVMFTSYFISDSFHDLFISFEVYLKWFIYDLATLAMIIPVIWQRRTKVSPGVWYVIIGLSINSFLLLMMHVDTVVLNNSEPWWLWSVYSIGVNTSDLTMIVVLIVDKDILGLVKSYNSLNVWVRKAFSRNCLLHQGALEA
ncbi:hypothetical protein V1358_07530 [Pseudoalteromonas sp. YIC-656]|uniref:hypothetical protein n=1 Tax=Pseudoalteromonas pernae TaxID=3118054 RepID=UPI003242CF4C